MRDDVAIPSPQGWLNVCDGIFQTRAAVRSTLRLSSADARSPTRISAALVAKTSGHLELMGVRPGDIVGVALGDDADHIVALLAVAWLGAVILPMDVRWTADEKLRIAAHFGVRPGLVPDGGERISTIETVICDETWRRGVGAPTTARVPLCAGASSRCCCPCHPERRACPRVPWSRMGTRSTGSLTQVAISLTFNEADRFMAATPLYFGGARYMTMAYLFMGATVVLYPAPYQADELAGAVNEKLITSLFLVPTLLRRLLEMPKSSLPLFAGLRLLLSSGSSLYPQERRTIMRELCPHFFNFYSSSEGGGISLLRPEHPDAVSLSVGKVVFGAEVEIIDDKHRPVVAGTVGAIRYRGGSVAESYYRNLEESATAFRDGWYYPGDLGRFDADGLLYLTGRSKDMIIRGGVNIYPAEIEQTLATHPAVAEAAVVGWPSQERGRGGGRLRRVPDLSDRAGSPRALPRIARALQDSQGDIHPRPITQERTGQGPRAGSGAASAAVGVTGRRI